MVEIAVMVFRQSRELGSPIELPILEGERIRPEPAVCCSEGTLTHHRSSTSINTGGQRGG